MSAVEDFRAAQDKEWGQYVAVTRIFFDGVLAYNVGDPVPASLVKKYGYSEDGLVAKTTSKAAAAATDTAAKG